MDGEEALASILAIADSDDEVQSTDVDSEDSLNEASGILAIQNETIAIS